MTERFAPTWLALREPHDHAARAGALVAGLDAALPAGAVDLLDLGCGLGSNLRYVAPRLDRPQRWILADHDEALLGRVPEVLARWAHARGWDAGPGRLGPRVTYEVVRLDLTRDAWPAADGVVAQALLDLLDEPTLGRIADTPGPLLAALTVDGRVAWDPPDADDGWVAAAFRADQEHGKPGYRAAGWVAARRPGAMLARADWHVTGDAAMLREMVDGTAAAAARHADPVRVAAWRERRLGADLRLHVGHVDLLAVRG